MKRYWRKPHFRWFLVVMIVMELFLQLLPFDWLGFNIKHALAVAGNKPYSITLNNSSGTAGSYGTYNGIYANSTTTTANVNINVGTGEQIDKVIATMADGSTQDVTPAGAAGQQTFNGTINLTGYGIPVESVNSAAKNSAATGYYAWDRYMIGDPHGTGWYESGGSCISPSSSSTMETINGVQMPVSPDCYMSDGEHLDNTLKVPLTRKTPYTITTTTSYGTIIVSSLVDASPSVMTFTPTINYNVPVTGPTSCGPTECVPNGTTNSTTKYISMSPDSPGDTDNFTVHYSQEMDQPSGYEVALASPDNGSREMVYYAAFDITIDSKTYIYPNQITVSYIDVPSGANLIGNITAKDTCIQVGSPETFTYTVTNNGSQDAPGPVTGHILADGVQQTTFSFPNGIAAGHSSNGTFTYTFQVAGSKTLTLAFDGGGSQNFTFTAQSTCNPTGPTVHADFTIQKSSMVFGDSNSFQPTVTLTGGCTIQTITWTESQNAITHTDTATSDTAMSFSGPPYPGGIGTGTVSVTMKVVASCGTQTVGPKTFTIQPPPQCTNATSGPSFKAGFVYHGNSTQVNPTTTAFPNDYLDLQIIYDSNASPASPSDPNGVGYYFTWDWSNAAAKDAWLNKYYTNYSPWVHDERFSFPTSMILTSSDLGTHSIDVYGTDLCGLTTKVTASVDVEMPNPNPIITLPPKAIEGRTVSPAINGNSSYSPRGNTITSYDWHGTYATMFPTAGDYSIKLDVTDSMGLTSLAPDVKTLTVQPDPPPIPALNYPSKGVRGVAMTMQDVSQTTLGDPFLEHTDMITCDNNLDGSFADDTPIAVTPDSNGYFTFTPTQLANCVVHIHLKKQPGYQRTADKDFPFAIVDQAPTVSISLTGEQPGPPVITAINYDLSTILSNRSQFQVETGTSTGGYSDLYYDSAEGALAAPDRSGALYLAPTPTGVTNVNPSFDCNSYADSNCMPFGQRATQNLYYTSWPNGGWQCSGGCWENYALNFLLYNTSSNTKQLFKKTSPDDYHQIQVNGQADMVWDRVSKSAYTGYMAGPGSGYHDDWYRLSDMAKGIFTPYKSTPYTVTSWHYAGGYSSTRIPDNPPPSWWIPVSKLSPSSPLPYDTVQSGTPVTTNVSPVKVDKLGNPFVNYCYTTVTGYDSDGNAISSPKCQLEKLSPSGSVIWRSPSVKTGTWDFNGFHWPYQNVMYVTSDNAKVYTTTDVYDNSNGNVIGTSWNLNLYPIWNDITIRPVTYNYQTTCWDDDGNAYSCTQTSTYYQFYNLRDGTVSLDSRNLSGGIPGLPGSGWSITEDGKYIALVHSAFISWETCYPGATYSCNVNKYHNILEVFDLTTGNHDYDVNLGDTLYNAYFTSFSMLGDGFVSALHSDNGCGDSCTHLIEQGKQTTISSTLTGGSYSYGDIIDKTIDFHNGAIYLSIKYIGDNFSDYVGAGIKFREQDNKNYYQASLTAKGVLLYKVVNGVQTVLDKESSPSQPGSYTDVKVTAKGDHLMVYVNGVPLIDVHDSTFTNGWQGLFSSAPNVYLKKYHIETYPVNQVRINGYSIVGTAIQSNVNYTDPENDPAIPPLAKWTYTNTAPQKFLDAGDGHSDTNTTNSYVNRTVVSPYAQLDKVGVFNVTFTEPDDPAPLGHRYPDSMYAAFRQYADPDTKTIIVHRAPISCFTITVNADGTISWNECGYDPDRWLSPSNYSTEKPEYASNHGIYQRLYGYTDPDGNVMTGKLTRPSKQGTYTLREAVADEYGAWSDWYEQQVYVNTVPPDNPPAVTLTFPGGTQDSPDYVSSLTPTITWNQSDPDAGTVFSQARIVVKDESGNVLIDRTINQYTSSNTGSWGLDTALSMGVKYQVQVMVSDDGGLWSPWSNVGWMITNRPPTAYMSYPWGTESSPTPVSTLQPTFQWSQSDPDLGDGITAYQLQVWDQAGTKMIYDSGKILEGLSTASSSSMTPSGNLNIQPHKPYRVRVEVWDSHNTASGFSPDAWMVLNRAPTSNFDWSPKPAYEGDLISLVNQSTDPDGDALTYSWKITLPDGKNVSSATTNASISSSKVGTYTVTLTASDSYGGSSSVTKTISVNPLGITGSVTHTSDWEYNREEYNLANSGNINSPWTVNQFLAGERFMLSATTTTITSPSTDVAMNVKVTLDRTGDYSWLTPDSSKTNWSGNLWKDTFASLEPGTANFIFEVTYSNGTVKQTTVPVEILAMKTTDFWLLKRDK